MKLTWRREPFLGGCCYYVEEAPLFISGSYPTDQFENDCVAWRASNNFGVEFPSADAAMQAAEDAWQAQAA
jgi:hypothetical protein